MPLAPAARKNGHPHSLTVRPFAPFTGGLRRSDAPPGLTGAQIKKKREGLGKPKTQALATTPPRPSRHAHAPPAISSSTHLSRC